MDARPATLLILATALATAPGCAGDEESETVSLYGTLYVGPEIGDPPAVLSGGHVDGFDDAGELLAEGSEPWPDSSPAYYRLRGLPPETHVNVVAWTEPAEEAGDDDDSAAEDPVSYVKTVHAAWMPPASLYTYDGELFILELDWMTYRLKLLSKVGLGQAIDGAVAPDSDGTGGFALGTMAEPELAAGTRIFAESGDENPSRPSIWTVSASPGRNWSASAPAGSSASSVCPPDRPRSSCSTLRTHPSASSPF